MKWRSLSLLACMLLTANAKASQTNWNNPICPSKEALAALANQAAHKAPPSAGMSIVVSHPKCGEWTHTYGLSDYVKKTAVTDDMKFPIASNTKPVMTALALIIMEKYKDQFPNGLQTKLSDIRDINKKAIFTADAKINLEDGKQFDLTKGTFYREQKKGVDFNCANDTVYQCPRFDTIDLHHLLMESSGLADVFGEADTLHSGLPDSAIYVLSEIFADGPIKHRTMTDLDTLKLLGIVKKADQEPMKPTQSHNTDALLLGVILERVTQESLPDLLEKYILKPLGATSLDMHFTTAEKEADARTARRYAYLNTQAEIDAAIQEDKLLPGIPKELASIFSAEMLRIAKKPVVYIQATIEDKLYRRPAFNMLQMNRQGYVGGFSAGGLVATPTTYIKFYSALMNGTLLSANAQQIFNQSFMAMNTNPSNGVQTSIGYGSNVRQDFIRPDGRSVSQLIHAGFVLGGESRVLHDKVSGTTVMIATNFSGYSMEGSREIPGFFMTKTPYFHAGMIQTLQENYLALMTQTKI